MQSKYQQQGLKVIAVNIDVERSDADAFLTEFAVNFNIIYDPDAVIGRQYQLKGMPSSFLRCSKKGAWMSSSIHG